MLPVTSLDMQQSHSACRPQALSPSPAAGSGTAGHQAGGRRETRGRDILFVKLYQDRTILVHGANGLGTASCMLHRTQLQCVTLHC